MAYIINDNTSHDELFSRNRGYLRPEGYGYAGVAEPFPQSLLVPRSEWQARITEMEQRSSRLSDLTVELSCKDQAQTNYCWANAPTYCVEVVRCLQNQSRVSLSPASAAAQIKNYRNTGGWGREALEWIVKYGLVPSSLWPDNAIDSRYDTASNKEIALSYQADEWWELEPNNLDHLISALLRRVPVAVGYNWWSHEVTAVDPVWLDNTVAIKFRNSWGMSFGDKGYAILQGNRMLPDDAVALRTVEASA